MTGIIKASTLCGLTLIAAVLGITLLTNTVFAQTDSVTFSKFRLHLVNGDAIVVKNGVGTADRLTGTSLRGENIYVNTNEVSRVERPIGTHAAMGAAIGLSIGCASGVALLTSSQVFDQDRTNMRFIKTIGTCAAIGTLIGLFVGSITPKWEPVSLPFSLGTAGTTRPPGINLAIRF